MCSKGRREQQYITYSKARKRTGIHLILQKVGYTPWKIRKRAKKTLKDSRRPRPCHCIKKPFGHILSTIMVHLVPLVRIALCDCIMIVSMANSARRATK